MDAVSDRMAVGEDAVAIEEARSVAGGIAGMLMALVSLAIPVGMLLFLTRIEWEGSWFDSAVPQPNPLAAVVMTVFVVVLALDVVGWFVAGLHGFRLRPVINASVPAVAVLLVLLPLGVLFRVL